MTAPSHQPVTLGILGGGQLGRMTALAAARLGVPVRLLAPHADGPADPFAGVTVADWTADTVLAGWAARCDVVTVESEWAPADRLAALRPDLPVRPSPEALVAVRHKGRQRVALHALPQPAYEVPASREAAREARRVLGGTVVAKQFEGSYDGYGNATCRSDADVDAAWERLAGPDGLLMEAFVAFEAEGAVTVARRPGGETAVYPLVRSEHRDHRLYAATVPAGLPEAVEAEARAVALAAVEALGVVGVATVELFLTAGGGPRVLVNEVAPRPHNTAHLTLDAHATSQFENHVRAVLDLPLGSPALRVPAAAMVNVLGASDGPAEAELAGALAVAGASVHLYGKRRVRPRRKMGHVTATAGSAEAARDVAERAAAAVRWR